MRPAFQRLVPYVLRYRRRLTLGLGCVVITTGVSLLSPWVLKYAIDDLSTDVTRGKLSLYASLLLVIAIVSGCFRFLMRLLIVGVSRDIEYDVRNDFYAHLQRLSLGYFQSGRTGDIMSRATNDLSAVRMMVGPAIMYSANTVIVFSVAILLMLSIDVRLTLIALIPLPCVSLSVKFFGSAIHRRFEQIQATLSDMSAVVQEALSGVRVVRAYRQEAAEMDRFRAANQDYLHRNRGLIQLQGLFFPSLALFLGLGGLLVLWLRSRAVVLGQISVGEFVAFNAYLVMLTWPMIAFGWVTNMLQRGMASWKRMLQIFDAVPAIADPDPQRAAGAPATIRGHLELRGADLCLRRVGAGARGRIGAGRTGADGGAGRWHGVGQIDAFEPDPQTARPTAGHGLRRWRGCARHSAGDVAWRNRLRAAGTVPVLRLDRRERRVRRGQQGGTRHR